MAKKMKYITLGEHRITTRTEIMPDDTVRVTLYQMPKGESPERYTHRDKDIVACFLLLPTANDFIANALQDATRRVKAIAQAKANLDNTRKLGGN